MSIRGRWGLGDDVILYVASTDAALGERSSVRRKWRAIPRCDGNAWHRTVTQAQAVGRESATVYRTVAFSAHAENATLEEDELHEARDTECDVHEDL